MKITRISLWHVPLTSHETYYMAEGKTCDTVETVVVRLDTDADLTGWGEYCAIPHYLPAYARGVAPAMTEMAPQIIGHDPLGAPAFMHRLNKWLIDHGYAKSPIDMALWDINAKAANQPLYNLLADYTRPAFPPTTRLPVSIPMRWWRLPGKPTPTVSGSFNANSARTMTGKPTSRACAKCVRRSAMDPASTVTGTAVRPNSMRLG